MSKHSQKQSSKTKYQVLSEILISDIKKGNFAVGDRLPSEEKLVSTLGYSLGTVQRALRHLAELGIVERVHGSGTFVTGSRAREEHLHHFRFLDEDGKTLLPIFFKTHRLEHTNQKGLWTDSLGEDDSGYIKIQRIISVNQEFELFSELYLSVTRFPTLLAMNPKELDGVSIRDMLIERFNTPTLETKQSILCSSFPPRVCRLINMPIGQFGIILTASSTTNQRIPIIWQRAYIPPSDRGMEVITQPHTFPVKS